MFCNSDLFGQAEFSMLQIALQCGHPLTFFTALTGSGGNGSHYGLYISWLWDLQLWQLLLWSCLCGKGLITTIPLAANLTVSRPGPQLKTSGIADSAKYPHLSHYLSYHIQKTQNSMAYHSAHRCPVSTVSLT